MIAPSKNSKSRSNRPLAAVCDHVASPRKPVPGAKITKPEFVLPMSAKVVDKLPQGDGWVYEIKWDGYRVEAIKHQDQVQLFSRKAKNLTSDFPEIRRAVTTIKAQTALIDGEVVSLDDMGRPSFQNLQHRARQKGPIVYYAFDLLNLKWRGFNRPSLERTERKAQIDTSRLEGALFRKHPR